jgi:hypothetical protein
VVSVFKTAMLIAPPIPTPLPPAASPPAVEVVVALLMLSADRVMSLTVPR